MGGERGIISKVGSTKLIIQISTDVIHNTSLHAKSYPATLRKTGIKVAGSGGGWWYGEWRPFSLAQL